MRKNQCSVESSPNNRRLTLLVVGPNSSGKSTCARYLASELDGSIIEFGDAVRDQILRDPSLDRDPSRAYEELLRRHGPSLLPCWAKTAISMCGQNQAIIMVGVRDGPAYRSLLNEFPRTLRIAVIANPAVRRFRDNLKQISLSPHLILSDKEFAERDALHLRWGLDILIGEADYTVRNDGSLEEFYVHLRLLFLNIVRENYATSI